MVTAKANQAVRESGNCFGKMKYSSYCSKKLRNLKTKEQARF